MNRKKILFLMIVFCAVLIGAQFSADAQVATGGQYTLDQSVIASGGATNSAAGNYTLGGTSGQSIAGQKNFGQSYSVSAGFWHSSPVAPTAAHVTVGGRVTTADGRGIRNVFIKMVDAGGNTRISLTTTFGYFRFDDVEVGNTYIFSVSAKSYQFAEPAQVRSISDSTDEINFVALDDI
ncbi:MAG TPA: hypothetical protein VNB22_12645 [Pyrinomonadaceae bacterium]|jgi:hypothetical protein|nr:hypothetical protein [Pyrinomonadaceae bacterium]